MKQNKYVYVLFSSQVLALLVAIVSLVISYQSMKTAETSLENAKKNYENIVKFNTFRSRIYSHSSELISRKSALLSKKSELISRKHLNWDNEFQDNIVLNQIKLKLNLFNPNLNEEFNEEDMRSCWLTDEQIGMIQKLEFDDYQRLKKNCMIEKINPTNKNWYDGEITILQE